MKCGLTNLIIMPWRHLCVRSCVYLCPQVKKLMAQQVEIAEHYDALQRKKGVKAEWRTHRQLRIVGGALAGRRLVSSQGSNTRPMMEKVRCGGSAAGVRQQR